MPRLVDMPLKLIFNPLIFFLFPVEDTERNDGSPDRPYYMNKELMKILGKKNNKLLDGNNLD